jgi:hypothetical protein
MQAPRPVLVVGGEVLKERDLAPQLAPTVSMMHLPTSPLEFASPLGNRADFELRSSRTVSHALAARTMTRAETRCSSPVALSM